MDPDPGVEELIDVVVPTCRIDHGYQLAARGYRSAGGCYGGR
jgi:hypothetical protein